MPDTNKQHSDEDPAGSVVIPNETQEEGQMGGDQADAGDDDEPQEPREPLELREIILQGFRTVSQTLSVAYGSACAEIQILVQKSLAKTTTEDWNFMYGASRSIHQWVDCIKLAMACLEQSTEEQMRLLVDARQARKDVLDNVLMFIPEEEVPPKLTPVFPWATQLLALALVVARQYTDEALRNVHAQLSDLIKEHMPTDQTGAFFNTILQMTCSFWQEMYNMASNQVLLPSQLVPNLWGSHRELLEGLSLMGPPSCSASWPASLVERVTAVPVSQNVPGSSKTPTKSNPPTSGVVKGTPDSGKKQLTIKQTAGKSWNNPDRVKEDAEVRKQEEKCQKKPTGPVLSLDEHEDSITDLTKWTIPSQVSQPANKASSSGSKDWGNVWMKHPVPTESDDEPLSDTADEPKTKSRRRDPTPDLVILEEDDSTPLPGKVKSTGKKPRTHTASDEEGFEALAQCLKAKARAIQYNLELTVLNEYWNIHIPNLKGPPNTDDHSEYLKDVKNVSWSYLAQGNIITAHQFYDDLKAGRDREAIEVGENVLWEKGMMGIPQESAKAGPVKCQHVIFVLRDIDGQVIDALDSDYGRDWNIRLYDIMSLASTRKVERNGSLIYKGKVVQGKVTYGYCPFCSYASTNHQTLNNHIRMHLCLTLACGMKDCWFVTHGSDAMWKHAAAVHGLTTSEPIAVNTKKK